jgi:hypothetical protein
VSAKAFGKVDCQTGLIIIMRTHSIEEGSDEDDVTNFRLQQIKTRTRSGLMAILLFIAVMIVIVGYRYRDTHSFVQDGEFYGSIRNYAALKEGEGVKQQAAHEGELAVTQKELGTMAWTILHMASGAFPAKFDEHLRERFLTFLVLFG